MTSNLSMTKNVLEGFVKEAIAQGIPQDQIPKLLKVASWLQAQQSNPVAFAQGADAVVKQAFPSGAVSRWAAALKKAVGMGGKAAVRGKPPVNPALKGSKLKAPGMPAAPAPVGGKKYGPLGVLPKAGLPLAYMGAGGLALSGANQGIDDTMQGMSDKRLIDQITQYRNQFGDFATRQGMMQGLPGMGGAKMQPGIGGPGF